MGRLLSERNRAGLDLAYRESLTETWGDRLVAKALMRVNVFVEERYGHFFNGMQHSVQLRSTCTIPYLSLRAKPIFP